MSKPLNENATKPITFEERVQLVKAEIEKRVLTYPVDQQNGARARLWVRWMGKSVLSHTAAIAARQAKPLNCDLYANCRPGVA